MTKNNSTNTKEIDQTTIILEQYKVYIESTDRFSGYRSQANLLFVSINSALVGLLAAVLELTSTPSAPWWILFSCITGILLNVTWFFLVRAYRTLNSGRFKVIEQIEQKLPMQLYKMEWNILTQDKSNHIRLSHIEQWMPVLFGLLYFFLGTALILF